MEKLSNDIREVLEGKRLLSIEEHLRETAKKWAVYSLDNYVDELLSKALAISKSIIDFLDKYEIK